MSIPIWKYVTLVLFALWTLDITLYNKALRFGYRIVFSGQTSLTLEYEVTASLGNVGNHSELTFQQTRMLPKSPWEPQIWRLYVKFTVVAGCNVCRFYWRSEFITYLCCRWPREQSVISVCLQCDRLITVFVGVSAGNHLIAVFCVSLLCDQMITLFFMQRQHLCTATTLTKECSQQDYKLFLILLWAFLGERGWVNE